ncbi:family 43 glycosylhydrolase [Streptomyces sp. NPDC021608]|uniref:family 43 glycosylhydrolase n=1 Tax=Streptomyces sp. NPDC021608 TaxID=3154903 RepID=UPI00340AC4A0
MPRIHRRRSVLVCGRAGRRGSRAAPRRRTHVPHVLREAADHRLGLLELTGSDPLKPASWTKKRTPVFQRSDADGVHGPGHDGFFTSPDGAENRILRHANSSAGGGSGIGRTTRAQKSTSGPG